MLWGWKYHKDKYNYNWSLATVLNEVNYVQYSTFVLSFLLLEEIPTLILFGIFITYL